MAYHKKKKKPKKQSHLFIIAVVIVAVLAAGAGGLFYYLQSQRNSQQNQPPAKEKTPEQRVDEVSNKAQGQAATGNIAGAYKTYDEEIAKTSDKKLQAWLLVNKATAAINGKKYDDAVNFARQAEALAPSYSTSLAMAQATEAKGDKIAAAQHYKTTAERYKTEAKDLPFYEADLEKFNTKARELAQ
ncbi:MAG TPA: hypothetical protein VD907_05355 [Verrucomicrobiae bacterium]|nr:hypothetical protein [Verrucomicrobiae bacterium]